MAARAGCPLYSTADVRTATAYEPEIPSPAAGTYLACTADERQALLTKFNNQKIPIPTPSAFTMRSTAWDSKLLLEFSLQRGKTLR